MSRPTTTSDLARPPRIPAGGRVGVVAPASPVPDRVRLDRAIDRAQHALDLRLDLRVDPLHHHGYYAGTDAERAAALVDALTDDDLDAVLCMRGGEGCMRALLALPADAVDRIRLARPKPLIGYSDVTILHAWLQREIGWVPFSGPVLTSFAEAGASTHDGFRRALQHAEPFAVGAVADGPPVRMIVPGVARGRLAGGCLSLITSLVGTPWELDLDTAILCFEDVGEPPRRIDQMLTQLLAAGHLDRVVGVVVGELVACHPGVRGDAYPHSLTIDEVVQELLVPLGVPVLDGLAIGHGRSIATLPLGVEAELDADAGVLRILEPGVT